MLELSNEELKAIELGILKDVAAFCDEKGIKYFFVWWNFIRGSQA